MSEVRRYALYHITQSEQGDLVTQDGTIFDIKKYSRFKFGSGIDTQEYGTLLGKSAATTYPEQFKKGTDIIIASAPYRVLPKAAQGLADSMQEYLNETVLLDSLPKVEGIKITSLDDRLDADYSSMTKVQRDQRNNQARLIVDREALKGKQILIVDDLRITGGTEEKIVRMLHDLNIPLMSVMMLYIAQLDIKQAAKDPQIEKKMNEAAIKSLKDLSKIIAAGNYLLNARVAMHILSSPDKDAVKKFFNETDEIFLNNLYEGVVADNLHTIKKYQGSFQILEDERNRREKRTTGKVEYEKNDEPYRFAVIDLNRKEDLPENFARIYSRMKYGNPQAVRHMAEILAKKIMHDDKIREVVQTEGSLMIAGSAYEDVPRGATVLAWDVAKLLTERRFLAENFKINNKGNHNNLTQYAAMSTEERVASLSQFHFWLEPEDQQKVAGKTVLVIDDSCTTGTHEKMIHEALKQTDIKANIFAYLLNFSASLSQEHSHFEEELNTFEKFDSLASLAPLFQEVEDGPPLVINARTIRFVLNASEKGQDVRALFEQLEESVLQKIYRAATAKDNYHQQPTTVRGFQILTSFLDEKGISY